MKYVDASAVLRVLFGESGITVPIIKGQELISSEILEVETFRAVDRLRLVGSLNDPLAARKRKELTDLLARLDLAPVESAVIARAKAPFAVNVRALDAIHVATAELLAASAGGDATFEFWTHDARQADAALSRGLEVRGIS